VARDGRDLVPGASCLGQTFRCGLSDPMGTAMGNPAEGPTYNLFTRPVQVSYILTVVARMSAN